MPFASCRHRSMVALFTIAATAPIASGGELQILSVSPARHALDAPIDSDVTITFDRPVNPATVTSASLRVAGRWSGPFSYTIEFSNLNQTVRCRPQGSWTFSAGEIVQVNLANTIQAADGSPLRTAGHAWQFNTAASPATRQFAPIDVFTNRTSPDEGTRLYGASGADLNRDGYLDLTTVNEDTFDLRVFMNSADGTGQYGDILLPPLPIGIGASPNEPADFNNDGLPDIAVAAAITADVWIALGNGNGTFQTPQSVAVSAAPHGLAVLDVDGDADLDIATANTGGSDVALMINNGLGVFGPATFFEGGGAGEYGLAAADMNNDGLIDLVVGARFSEDIIVHLNNGNGTFTGLPTVDAGGGVWMISLGDLNGDGNIDVATANGTSSSGSILLGDGTGNLNEPSVYLLPPHCISTDLGDLDGDGDLDWIISSFGGGQWLIYENDGTGDFTFDQSISARSNSSCALLIDIDNDRDLDVVTFDEIADMISVYKNRGPAVAGDMNCDGRIDGNDVASFVKALLDGAGYLAQHPYCLIDNGDVNSDNAIDTGDVDGFVQLLIQ